MATAPRKGKSADSYRTIGKTYDGVRVVAPKTKSKRFTEADIRKIVAQAIKSVEQTVVDPPPLAKSKAPKIEKRDDGTYAVKRTGKKKASAVTATQAEAIARARVLEPGAGPIVKRERKSPAGKKGTWRKA